MNTRVRPERGERYVIFKPDAVKRNYDFRKDRTDVDGTMPKDVERMIRAHVAIAKRTERDCIIVRQPSSLSGYVIDPDSIEPLTKFNHP